MKRFIFLALILTTLKLWAEPVFHFADFKSSVVTNFYNQKENSASLYTGLRLKFYAADLRAYVTMPKTEFSTINNCISEQKPKELFNEVRWGSSFNFFTKTLPTTLKFGTLTYSQAISRLKNPAPSVTASPITKSFGFLPGLESSLPSLTSSVQSKSLYLKSTTKNKSNSFSFESFLTEEKNFASSLVFIHNPLRFLQLQYALTGVSFNIEGSSSLLKKNNASFEKSRYEAFCADFSARCPLLKANFYFGAHQNPYGSVNCWFNSKFRFSKGRFLGDFGYFCIIPNSSSPKVAPLVGIDCSVCRTVNQFFINPQLIFFPSHADSLRFGFLALKTYKHVGTSKIVYVDTLKLSLSALAESKTYSAKCVFSACNILLDGIPPNKSSAPERYYDAGFSAVHKGDFARLSLTTDFKFYPPMSSYLVLSSSKSNDYKKEIFSASVSSALGKQITASLGGDATFKDGKKTSSNAQGSLTWKIKNKKFTSSVKAAFTLEI